MMNRKFALTTYPRSMQTARYAPTDGQRETLRPLPPPDRPTGRPPRDHRLVLDAILCVLHAGAPWRDLPDRFGPWQSAHHRFDLFRKRGVWGRDLEALTRDAELDHSRWNLDGTVVRAERSAAGAGAKSAAPRRAG